MLKSITEAIERSAQGIVNEFGTYAPMIDYLSDRLAELRKDDKPIKECSILAGFALALADAKCFARKEAEGE